MNTKVAATLLAGAIALGPAFSSAGENDASLEQLVVQMADKPSDHAVLAKYYRAKAAEERATASTHQSMSQSYGGGKLAHRQQMESHCKKLSEQSAAMANEYEALAKLHEDEAKKTP